MHPRRTDPGQQWDCVGASVVPLAVSAYSIGDVSPATTGTFDVQTTVLLSTAAPWRSRNRVDPIAADAGCLARRHDGNGPCTRVAQPGPVNAHSVAGRRGAERYPGRPVRVGLGAY